MYKSTMHVLHHERVGIDTFLLIAGAPEVARESRPGQFVMVRCGELPLRRPISVHASSEGSIALLYRAVGDGTTWLSSIEQGQSLDITGPLGNGYSLPDGNGRVVLVAGGMGIAPLCFLAARLAASHEVILVHGARTAAELYEVPGALCEMVSETRALRGLRWIRATDDGSNGACGSALDLALPHLEQADYAYLCGPHGMCVAAHDRVANTIDITRQSGGLYCSPKVRELLCAAQVSLEVRMGCGVGACYACSIPTVQGRRKVCADGPVFRFGDVLWEGICT